MVEDSEGTRRTIDVYSGEEYNNEAACSHTGTQEKGALSEEDTQEKDGESGGEEAGTFGDVIYQSRTLHGNEL